MDRRRHVTRMLHDEHMATVAVLERLEALLGRQRAATPPDIADAGVVDFLRALGRAIETEIGPHFAFEEKFLFPRFVDAGDSEMSALLIEEHKAIMPLATRLANLAERARDGGFTGETWREFHAIGAELVERLISHIQKEEMGVLPVLDDALDDEADSSLALELTSRR